MTILCGTRISQNVFCKKCNEEESESETDREPEAAGVSRAVPIILDLCGQLFLPWKFLFWSSKKKRKRNELTRGRTPNQTVVLIPSALLIAV